MTNSPRKVMFEFRGVREAAAQVRIAPSLPDRMALHNERSTTTTKNPHRVLCAGARLGQTISARKPRQRSATA
jgi:hypothetical protein